MDRWKKHSPEPRENGARETLAQLVTAAEHLKIGFQRAVDMDRAEQADAMREASAALIEMRRTTDDLAYRLRNR